MKSCWLPVRSIWWGRSIRGFCLDKAGEGCSLRPRTKSLFGGLIAACVLIVLAPIPSRAQQNNLSNYLKVEHPGGPVNVTGQKFVYDYKTDSFVVTGNAVITQAKTTLTADKVTMLADGAAAFAKAIGLELDLNARGMGWRSQRYALIADDGKVTHLGVEAPGGFEVSKAEAILAAL